MDCGRRIRLGVTISRPDTGFITTNAMLETIENHVKTLSARDKTFARYFSLTHLYNAGETTEALQAYRRALSKLINSLSWGRDVVIPKPIDAEETLFYIDLRDYEWDVRNDAWTQIEQVYPYKMTFDAPTQTPLREKLTTLQQEMNCEVPFVHVDWFLATASLPPLYHDILALPETDRELEAVLMVFVTTNLQNAPGERVWRAGFNDSGVSRHNRVVERHTSQHGAYWKSYDFAGSAESQNIFTHPLDFKHDGGEIIFNLPNGLQAYYLVDARGSRLDVAPTSIVSNPAASDPAVRNGLSCIGCHTQGMKTVEDEVRAVVDQAANPPFDKVRALDLYVEKTVMDELVEEDTQRYRDALEAAGGVFGGIEPIQRFYEVFHGSLSAAHAAAAVGLETDVFLEKISKNVSLQNLLGILVLEDGTVKRDAWTSNFDEVISVLNSPDSVLPPIEQRPERIPGASVYIPDVNLRAAIEEALGKASGDVITVEDMATLTELHAEGLGIRDIIGLEFATNLKVLEIRGNMITNISSVSGLTKLSLLRIADNMISDISPITQLTNITSLEIYANEISDISPLAGLTNIGWLSMYNNPVSDISPLANLEKLQAMRVSVEEGGDLSPLGKLINLEILFYWGSGNPVPDLTPLTNLPKLRALDIRGGGTVDLSPLTRVTTLESFDFWATGEPIPDLSPLRNLSKLTKIVISGIEISDGEKSDMSPLAGLIGLKELWVINSEILDISFLENLTGLERLNLEGNNISDVSPLAGLTNLKWLKLINNPITDFSPLLALSQTTNIIAGHVDIPDRNLRSAIADALGKGDTTVISITFDEMSTLTELDAANKGIRDLMGLQFATNLQNIRFFGNQITELSSLANLRNLESLNLSDNEISDILPLKNLPNLRWLNLVHNQIVDLSPLENLRNLRWLNLARNHIVNLSSLKNLTQLEELSLWSNQISDISPLAGLLNLKRLDLRSNDIVDVSPLGSLHSLKHLHLNGNKISNISALTSLHQLESLSLGSNEISDVSPLVSLHDLKSLELHHNQISIVSPLSSLHNLEKLTLHGNLISDFSPVLGLPALASITRAYNPVSPIAGTKIEGPWLWAIIPGGRWLGDTDFLAEASDGAATELKVATHGAKEGKAVGDSVWTSHTISPTGSNNINEMTAELGWGTGIEIYDHIIYGSITMYSPKEQQTHLFVGTNDAVKVWLNGELVYQDLSVKSVDNYVDYFPLTLKQGVNVLLVAVDNRGYGLFSGFWGFEEGTEYTLLPPGVGFTFSTTETNLLAGDTFTLNLNAENISDLAGWQVDVAFDPNVLEAIEVTEGDFLKSEGDDTFFQGGTIDNTAGKITGIFAVRQSASGASGTGTLLSVTFMAKAGGETQVTLENFEFISITDDIIPTVPPNISITVGEYPAWDVNQDGRVSIQDLILVATGLGFKRTN